MKNFRVFFYLFLAGLIVVSCAKDTTKDLGKTVNESTQLLTTDDDDDDGTDDDDDDGGDKGLQVGEYPAAIDDYIAQEYPTAVIEEVELASDGTYEVELTDDTELIFDAEGNFVSVEVDDNDDDGKDDDDDDGKDDDDDDGKDDDDDDGGGDKGLQVGEYPAAIDDYIAQEYPTAVIEEVELASDGTYEVELMDDTELIFDAEGNFVSVEVDDNDDDGKDDDDDDDGKNDDDDDSDGSDNLQVGEYPAAIDDYIAQQYPTAVIEEVELASDGTYEVELTDDTELVFDAEGNFVSVEEDDDDDDDDDGKDGAGN